MSVSLYYNMPTLGRIASYVILAAMFIAGGAPLLADTAPGSDRSIAQAIVGVLLAVGALLNVLQMRALQKRQQVHEGFQH